MRYPNLAEEDMDQYKKYTNDLHPHLKQGTFRVIIWFDN